MEASLKTMSGEEIEITLGDVDMKFGTSEAAREITSMMDPALALATDIAIKEEEEKKKTRPPVHYSVQLKAGDKLLRTVFVAKRSPIQALRSSVRRNISEYPLKTWIDVFVESSKKNHAYRFMRDYEDSRLKTFVVEKLGESAASGAPGLSLPPPGPPLTLTRNDGQATRRSQRVRKKRKFHDAPPEAAA